MSLIILILIPTRAYVHGSLARLVKQMMNIFDISTIDELSCIKLPAFYIFIIFVYFPDIRN